VDTFLTVLSVCHTVLPDFPSCMKEHVHTLDSDDARLACRAAVEYQAASPDEKALAIAAKNQAYYFFHREPAQIKLPSAPSLTVNGETVLVNILGEVVAFSVLESFEFSSERARMSVVVLDPRDGQIKVLTKGSDTKMYKLLSDESRSQSWTHTEESLKEFAQFGLRTLLCGYKIISEADYVKWQAEYARAKASIDKREESVAYWQNEIEQGLTLLGSTSDTTQSAEND